VTRGEANLIRAFSLWTVGVWLVRARNIVTDPEHSFGFKAVHVFIAVISVAFAIGAWIVVMRNRAKGKPVVRDAMGNVVRDRGDAATANRDA
jgi:hypothetical protein